MESKLWQVRPGEPGSGFDIVDAIGWLETVADEAVANHIVAAHNAAVYELEEELERLAWLADANYEAWLAATGQNGGGRPKPHNPITGSDARPAMRHSALGRD